ncbi:MAG: D-alanyl-D-alanine carboxypeptidase/D-alanyl-D-alanine-endopeptidase [Rhodoferax sp.]|uniref:D-alanyl-D-alanine carboxypeptidase/D-alanyl-D-alanine endopeptidase n=1 Tax=Rhodoferax sp. TaxID=50421 RepID=UPI00262FE797|nr:D-alanyl-D-alanine carboxypeptidase/D-alanyl-D-alanine-endopeptidase [Rhodoferax sp.]MDD2879954.1 D-alanyl-D-alanine carboxypeptidase/D-alanyl-D-alanine-endopeptidase [Rhodoferax sp.]
MTITFKPWPGRTLLLCAAVWACATSHATAQPQLPPEVQAALTRAQVPADALAVLVVAAEGQAAPRLSHRADVPVNPASVMKLVTTYAALDLLGPAFVWRTPVWLDGPVEGGVLKGNLVIQGQGDPKLVLERLWLLLRRVQGLGVQRIAGNIVLDRRAFAVPPSDPGEFDGEPLRPYNAAPDALLLNFKAVVMTFTPEANGAVARVQIDPPLAGVQLPTQVPLAKNVACNDYRATLKADFSDPKRIRFAGSYPASCGEKVWPVAYADPASYNARAIEGLWRNMGGRLDGNVVDGVAPSAAPSFELTSPTLMEVIRDINKFSNNVMAQQLFLTLGLPGNAVATPDSARVALRQWWQRRISAQDVPAIDNGSGLSRQTRISAQQLGQLLQVAYASPNMPELMSSLPIVGVDGTLKRSRAGSASAHLKTGSLREVTALAGYVHATSGKRYVLVAIVNHPNAGAVRPALDALVDWAVMDNQGH